MVVVGWVRGRTNTPRYPLTLNLNGLGLRCCSTVPLSTVEAQSDSSELQEVFLSRLQVISRTGLWFNNTMADQGSPVVSGTGGFTPINRSPGNDSMSSGLPVHDDKKRRSDAQVAAVVMYDRPKANPEPLRDLQVSSSSDAGSHRTSGGVLVAGGAPSQRGSASSGFQGGSRRLSSAVIPDPGGVAHGARISVPIIVDQSFAINRPLMIPLQGNEGTQQVPPLH